MRNKKGQFVKGHIGYKAMLGRYFSAETRKKISIASSGRKLSEEAKKKLSELWTGRKLSEETKKKIGKAHKGKKLSEEHKRKLSVSHKGQNSGANSRFWKGGITPENVKIRTSFEYNLWRRKVFKKDRFVCQKCHRNNKKLRVHHINNFARFPELRFEVNNGITFCEDHHNEFHKLYGKKNNTKEQIKEFLVGYSA